MVVGYTLTYILWLFVWFLLVHRDIDYTFIQLLADMLPFMGITCLAVAAAWFVTRGIASLYWLLAAKILVTAAVYLLLMWLTKSVTFKESVQYLLNLVRHKNNNAYE